MTGALLTMGVNVQGSNSDRICSVKFGGNCGRALMVLFACVLLSAVCNAADYTNSTAIVYLIDQDSVGSDETAQWIAEKLLGGLASTGFEKAVGVATTHLAGKLGGLFVAFLLEMPLVGNPTLVELVVLADGEPYTRSVLVPANSRIFTDGHNSQTMATVGGVTYAHPPVAAAIVVTPGDCTGTPVVLRLEKSVGLFRWQAVWEQTVLTGDEVSSLGWQLGDRLVIGCTMPIAIEQAGRYRLVAESGCSPTVDAVKIVVSK